MGTTVMKRRKAWRRKNHEPLIPTFPAEFPSNFEEFLTQELGYLEKAFVAGNKGALLDAVVLCLKHRMVFPEWLGLGVIDAIKENLVATPPGRKWLKRFRQDMIDYERADWVEDSREHGLQWEEACTMAAEALQGTVAAGSEDAIKKSYQRFKRNYARDPSRYRLLKMVHLRETPRSERERREFMEYMNTEVSRVRASGD